MKTIKISAWIGVLFALAHSLMAEPAPVAPTRSLTIAMPRQVAVAANFNCVISAETNALGAEQIGFLHVEYSEDGGQTWIALFFGDNVGRSFRRSFPMKSGLAGRTMAVRVRAAFRGGKAGDVDHAGNSIDWDGSWSNWGEGPAKSAVAKIVAR